MLLLATTRETCSCMVQMLLPMETRFHPSTALRSLVPAHPPPADEPAWRPSPIAKAVSVPRGGARLRAADRRSRRPVTGSHMGAAFDSRLSARACAIGAHIEHRHSTACRGVCAARSRRGGASRRVPARHRYRQDPRGASRRKHLSGRHARAQGRERSWSHTTQQHAVRAAAQAFVGAARGARALRRGRGQSVYRA